MSYLKDELSGFIPEEISSEIIKDVARGNKRFYRKDLYCHGN